MQSNTCAVHGSHPTQPTSSGLVAVRVFCRELNIAPSTHWRWERRGWIGPSHNIGGRKYHTTEQITEFKRRAEAGEFAANIKPPHPTKSLHAH